MTFGDAAEEAVIQACINATLKKGVSEAYCDSPKTADSHT